LGCGILQPELFTSKPTLRHIWARKIFHEGFLMSTVFDQTGRLGKLHTAFAFNELVLLRFTGTDKLNSLYEFQIEALSTNPNIDFDALVGTHATVELDAESGPKFHDGIVTSAQWAGQGENGIRYNLTLRPWLWLAGRKRNQRIFHKMKVGAILKELLQPYQKGGALYEDKCTEAYPELEYTVQYRESDLEFACRMMERFGISYHFKHGNKTHTLVLTDGVDLHDEIGPRPYKGVKGHNMADKEHFWEWTPARNITTGAIRLIDYNFKKPTAAMEVDQKGDAKHANGDIESFDYPGDYLEQGEGKGVAARRAREERGNDARHKAQGDVTSLSSGLKVTLNGDDVPGATGQTYLCLTASHAYVSQGYGSGTDKVTDDAYSGSYTLMPASAPMTPDRKTRQPVVQGPQTAVVVGDGEIDCDEFGRILVKFHWDLKSAHSMRCRVSQIWAGQGWGGVAIPRIGMEVIVEFLEGDPDKPLVTGCVYNGKNGTPYTLPANKTRTTLRSNTHKGAGYNEISFEDENEKQDIFIHAQKDLTVKVLNNESSNVLANRTTTIGVNDSLTVKASSMQRVEKSKTVTVGGDGPAVMKTVQALVKAGGQLLKKGSNKVGAGGVLGFASDVAGVVDLGKEIASVVQKGQFAASGEHKTIAGTAQSAAGKAVGALLDKIMPSSGIMTTTVEKFRSDTTGIAATEQVGVSKSIVVGGVFATAVGKLMSIVVGDKLDIEAKKSIFARTKKHTLMANEKFVIAGPGGSITIDSSGIVIKAIKLEIKSPNVNFTAGSPDQVEALSSDKPFVQECKGK
jgi:type VI secretion system secreted protein VgrG